MRHLRGCQSGRECQAKQEGAMTLSKSIAYHSDFQRAVMRTKMCLSNSENHYLCAVRFRAVGKWFEQVPGDQQPRVFELQAAVAIAINRVVAAFDVQVGIVSRANEGMDDFRPIRLS